MASDITEHNEVNVGHQFSSEDCQKSQISAEGSSPRDDGYDSKAGESVADESNFDDDDKDTSTADGETITTDVDSALQLSQSLNLNSLHESETEKANEIEKSFQRDQSKEETGAIEEAVDDGARVYHSSFSDEQWDQIYEVLERFSQNTMTLMSWIDELRDLDSEDPTGPSFYDSNSSRKRNIITHTQRVYENVIEDAAMLLKNLPSEKTTILIVLQKVELKCEGLNVCNSDDITELSNIQSSVDVQDHAFLSSKLKSELVDPLASYDDFKPIVTSTPKRSLNKSTPAQRSPATPKKTTRFLDPVEFNPAKKETTALSYRIPAARPSTHQSRRGWNDFISEYNDTLEWLERMENMIRQTELSDVLTEDADLLLEKYYLEFSMNSSKRQTLEVKGNYLSVVYPELKRDVRRKLNDVESFWDSLKLRLDDDYRLLPLTPVTRLERKERIRLLRPYRFERYSLYRPFHYHVSVRKQSLPLPIPEVQLSDFSLHQIRDQLGFGPTLRHKSLLKDEQRANRFDVRRSLHPYLPSPSTDFLNPLRPSIRPHLTESNSGDTEFRGRIFMSPYRKFNCPYRRTHPRVGPVTTTEKSLFNEKREGETIRGPLKSITKYIRTDDKEESDIFSTNPLLLSSRIIEFQAWLAEEELDTYNKSSPPLGWSPTILQKFLRENQVTIPVFDSKIYKRQWIGYNLKKGTS
ncbi:unnamed protein product [Clavelina lepadiformis]|uniref:Uncharacterized protein n=1 Tax=Clavelina lepadiformis TaxID=159417 RepID=A0ABP0GLE5_CLALP